MLLATKAKIAPWGCYLSTKETSQGLCAKSLSILSVRHSGAGGTNSGACHLTIHCSCSVFVANSLWPHGPQHARPPHPSPSPGTCPSSCSLHQWCHPAISSSDTLFSFCPQSFPASWTFPVSHLFTSDDQNTGASASASVLLVNIQDWSLLRLTVLLSLLSKGLWGVFFSTTVQRINSLVFCLFTVQLSQPYMTTGKTIALTIWTSVGRVMSPLFSMLSRFVITFLPRSNRLLISWLRSLSSVILEPMKRKSVTTFTFFPFYLPCNNGAGCHVPSFFNI